MALIKRKGIEFPFGPTLLSDFFSGDRFFGKDVFTPERMPAVNIEENDTQFVIEMAVPGMRREDFSVGVENGLITISAERKNEEVEEKRNFTRREFSFESFSRSFTLPENVTEDNIEAVYLDGLLKLTIPKKESKEVHTKNIEIR
ncbi:MAG: Hsp20/alpha crystallin family protein [Chitinophagales bacterium]|nr:Hsp20/alpha crystallin family protein [Chitinophagales bacterium]HAE12785.1 molecular chaperone Hsp20 [Bacteroidota bacterium]MCB9019298.1 Hsp20/alpha crystallin family protein [Chitinophagales bacterium]MCB9020549.1 Hsp20/alpha crystallin family protein [Chitinophagales bacterium]MCB9031499.1 Hsp20/alpha crystallin family protein [Chitinophagales bacterium]